MNIFSKIFHNSHCGPKGPFILMIFILPLFQLNRENWTKFSAINYSSEPAVSTNIEVSMPELRYDGPSMVMDSASPSV